MTTDSLQRADRLVWSLAAIALTVNVVAAVAGPFRMVWSVFAGFVALSVSFYGIGLYCRRRDAGERLASGLICMGQAILFASMAAPLTYVAASAALPLWDVELMRWDRHLGFDWMAWVVITNNHPFAQTVLREAYASIGPQWLIAVAGLAIAGRFLHLRIFLAAIMLTILVSTALSVVCPAAGPWSFQDLEQVKLLGASPASMASWHTVHDLRVGSLRLLFGPDLEGIVTFPSVHAAAGLLFILAWWPVRYLRWVSLTVNTVMIASTPVYGGHYLIDVIAGLILAMACWKVASAMIGTRVAITVPQIPGDDAPSIIPGTVTSALTSHRVEPAQQKIRSGVI